MVLSILNELEATSSKNAKVAILKRECNNQLLWKVIRLALDPFTQFYIRKIPAYTQEAVSLTLEQALSALSELSMRNVTGNDGIAHLRNILSSLPSEEAKVIERVIAKDLKCGVNIGSVNAVKPNFIFEYPVMLCSKLEQRLLDKITYPAVVQQKLDGMRFNAIVKDGKVEFRSRSGKSLDFNGYLESDFIELAKHYDTQGGLVFDGELLIADGESYVDRKAGNGILSRANKFKLSVEDSALVRAVLWDVIDYTDFIKHKSDKEYRSRMFFLENSLEIYRNVMLGDNSTVRLKLAETHFVDNLDSANDIFQSYLAQGHEGIILKDMFCGWEFNRVNHQIKFKGELECDLEVIDWVEGSGKYAGKLGALVCTTSDRILNVSVGSGFNDEQRSSIDRSVIGKIITVKYNERISNKSGEESLFLPIFIEVREDKTVANSILELE